MNRLVLLILFLLLIATNASAKWMGPEIILSLDYGSGDGHVGLDHGDTEDVFPSVFAVSPSGKIAIFDLVNLKILLFNSDGTFLNSISGGTSVLTTNPLFTNGSVSQMIFISLRISGRSSVKASQGGGQVAPAAVIPNMTFIIEDS